MSQGPTGLVITPDFDELQARRALATEHSHRKRQGMPNLPGLALHDSQVVLDKGVAVFPQFR